MKAVVDQKKCLGCGLCVRLYPELFEMDFHIGLSRVKEKTVREKDLVAVRDAENKCPGKAISLSEQ